MLCKDFELTFHINVIKITYLQNHKDGRKKKNLCAVSSAALSCFVNWLIVLWFQILE